MSTRLNDLSTGHKTVIRQRLHQADLTGDLLGKGGFELLWGLSALPELFLSFRVFRKLFETPKVRLKRGPIRGSPAINGLR
jgi:hypothetical protein